MEGLKSFTIKQHLLVMTNATLHFAADREVQRILLELLNQMDGFDQNVNVKVRMLCQLLKVY